MSFPYPPKPWQDGQTVRAELEDGIVLIGVYEAEKNVWHFSRSTTSGGSGVVTTADVFTLNTRPTRLTSPFSLSNDPNTVVNQQEANWWLFEDLDKRARKPIIQDTEPTIHPLYSTDERFLIKGDMWIDITNDELYWWDGSHWQNFSGDRAHIVQASPPTKHPDFGEDPLKVGDLWIDGSDIMHYWDGSTWVEVVDSESYADKYLKKHGHDVDDAPATVAYSWNQPITFSSEEYISITANTSGSSKSRILMPTDGSTRIESTNFTAISDSSTSMYSESTTSILAKSDANLGSNENSVNIGAKKDIWLASGETVLVEAVGDVVLHGVGPTSKELVPRTIFKASAPDKQITNKEYVDAQDEILQQEIIELEEEIDAIAPSTQRGEWEFDMSKGNPDPGKYYLLKELGGGSTDFTDQYSEAVAAVFHNTDANSVTNTWAGVEVDELIQIFDRPDPDFVLGTITVVDTTTVQDAVLIRFNREKAIGSPDNNPSIKLSRVNIFEAPTGGEISSLAMPTPAYIKTGPLSLDTPVDNSELNVSPDRKTLVARNRHDYVNNSNDFYISDTRYLRVSKDAFEAAFPGGIENYTFMPGQMVYYGTEHRQAATSLPMNMGAFLAISWKYHPDRWYEIEVSGSATNNYHYKYPQNKYIEDSIYDHFLSFGCFWRNP